MTTTSDSPSASKSSSASASASAPTSERPGLIYQADGAVRWLAPGSDPREIAPEVQQDKQHPDWSPDGTTIVFDSNFSTLWMAGLDGPAKELSACAQPCAALFDGAWSPDGREVAFVRILGDGVNTTAAQVVAKDVETQEERVIHEDTAGDVWLYQPRWSPDGTRLLVESDRFASTLLDEETVLSRELRVIDATGDQVGVPGTRGVAGHDWSPIEDLFVFEDDGNLVTMRADGTERTQLTSYDTSTESAIQPTFTSDGTAVVFTLVRGVPGSGNETLTAAVVTLADAAVVEVEGADGATHARLQPVG